MEVISTSDAPQSSAPLSQAIKHGDTVYVAGNVPVDPETGDAVGEGDITAQTEQVMENISAVLDAAGSSMDQVMRAGVYLRDMNHFADMNEVYESYVSEPYPARTAIRAEMAADWILVEIDCIAAIE